MAGIKFVNAFGSSSYEEETSRREEEIVRSGGGVSPTLSVRFPTTFDPLSNLRSYYFFSFFGIILCSYVYAGSFMALFAVLLVTYVIDVFLKENHDGIYNSWAFGRDEILHA